MEAGLPGHRAVGEISFSHIGSSEEIRGSTTPWRVCLGMLGRDVSRALVVGTSRTDICTCSCAVDGPLFVDCVGSPSGVLRFVDNSDMREDAGRSLPKDMPATVDMNLLATRSEMFSSEGKHNEAQVTAANAPADLSFEQNMLLDGSIRQSGFGSSTAERVSIVSPSRPMVLHESMQTQPISLESSSEEADAERFEGRSLVPRGCLPPPPTESAPLLEQPVLPPPPRSAVTMAAEARLLRKSPTVTEMELGSQKLPTVGSASHRYGACKPCAFVHTKGCANGVRCPFCHLCAPDERRRRKDEKKRQRRDARRCALSPSEACGRY